MKRVIIVVLDSVGMGELPDAASYGDVGSNTLGNIAKAVEGFKLPNLQLLGLGNIDGMVGYKQEARPKGNYARMVEVSSGKDTTTGHWEIAGLKLEKPFPVYPNGFPREIIESFEKEIGTKTLCNCVASGTEIIKEFGEEHIKTGYPIVYTSADSVFQIAAHEEVIPIEKQYEMCSIVRKLLTGEHAVGRVIARPFAGTVGNFTRTDRRRDFSLKPIGKTFLSLAQEKGLEVKAVGKIEDIFAGQGITFAIHTHNNLDGVQQTLNLLNVEFEGVIFTNLVDYDMLYGHRNNVIGYANALKEFDDRLPDILDAMKNEDILIMTADHGCDPTTASTDHSREYVPLIVYGKNIRSGINLGTRGTFSDVAATVAEYLDLGNVSYGISFYSEIKV